MSIERFKALVLREWMQHKRGWLLSVFGLPAVFMLLLPIGRVDLGDLDAPAAIAVVVPVVTSLVMLGVCLIVSGFQWSGLARRDVQDRSIEFWLSLPGSHVESLSAQLLAHGMLLPMAAVLASVAVGGVVTAGVLVKTFGPAGLAAMSLSAWVGMVLPMVLSFLIGVPLMMLWLSPFVLTLMAASAWLKRWGVPSVGLLLVGSAAFMKNLQQSDVVGQLLSKQVEGAMQAMLGNSQVLSERLESFVHTGDPIPGFAGLVLQDMATQLGSILSPHFFGGLAVTAAGFWLLVLKRSRGG